MLGTTLMLAAIAVAALIGISLFFWTIALRRVVPVNEVHIVQTRKNTVSYGKGFASNTYYEWPSRIPMIGLVRVTLPVSNFSIDLPDYAAYDKERVPFLVHVMAFFRISDSNTAAQRVASFEELKEQLTAIVQGSVRTVLAAHEIDQIMLDRSRFGEAFTKEVTPQLGGWGVEAIKNIELMDIRDSKESEVIQNIMAKRTSGIERESRLVVADNARQAEMAEIAAKREIEMSRQQAAEQVGLRTAEKEKNVGVANEQSSQQVKVQQRETAAKEMDVVQVKNVRGAEINREVAVITAAQAKEVAIVQADAAKQVAIVSAEGSKQQTVLTAEGKLEAAKRNAEGIAVEGSAKGTAETAILMAPVDAQIKLAEKIGSDQGYQNYLLGIRNIEAAQAVGTAQAEALKSADVKVISNAGTPSKGLSSVMDLFSADGGTAIASMLEGLAQSPEGKKVLEKFANKKPE
ncbi:SPFH domain-containing protein [Pseudoxanthomonas sp. CF125]|jgi:flotillin|uniref:SPFH domain-containing protein n=1 Tax=Pseudoxanthomonas sp. CF125 TaxID=1855303 RepID=UPI00088B9A70|nr:SPFH domain-containing protein [Pseudoxanthomonas sp. CF125]SDQ26048.1 flotillin [Pseudoxanthomonas sp. CF125]